MLEAFRPQLGCGTVAADHLLLDINTLKQLESIAAVLCEHAFS